MVGHQAVCPHLDPGAPASFGQQVPIGLVVLVVEEGLLAAVAALGDVVRRPLDHHSGQSCHDLIVAWSCGGVNWVLCPRNSTRGSRSDSCPRISLGIRSLDLTIRDLPFGITELASTLTPTIPKAYHVQNHVPRLAPPPYALRLSNT